MGVINSVVRWLLLDRLGQIETFQKYPHDAQNRVLKNLLSTASTTEWGKRYGFSRINSYEDFAKTHPLHDYNSLKPEIERTMSGEQNILWPSPIHWFAKSSGTTQDKSKFIPVSKESLEDCHFKAGKDLYALYYHSNPNGAIGDGRTLVLGGSSQVHRFNSGCFYGDLSAVLMQNLPFWVEARRVPELSIALMDNWEEKIEKMARSTIDQNITNIVGVPTWTVLLIRRLFELSGKDNLADLWPNIELYVHGGVSFEPYRELFRQLIRSDKMHYLETYNASEGFFGIQDSINITDMLLMLDYGIFYEFIPSEEMGKPNPEVIPLEEVKEGRNYAMVISTNGGLWRYQIGDTVKFTSVNPYRIKVSGRTRHYINAFGEEVIVENAEKAIAEACRLTHAAVSDFTAAPVYFSEKGNGAHEWLIEFEKEPDNFEIFVSKLDESLKTINSDYEAKRFKDMALRKPIVRKLPSGTFYSWLKHHGKLGGQNKVPRLSNSREIVEEVLKLSN